MRAPSLLGQAETALGTYSALLHTVGDRNKRDEEHRHDCKGPLLPKPRLVVLEGKGGDFVTAAAAATAAVIVVVVVDAHSAASGKDGIRANASGETERRRRRGPHLRRIGSFRDTKGMTDIMDVFWRCSFGACCALCGLLPACSAASSLLPACSCGVLSGLILTGTLLSPPPRSIGGSNVP